MELRLSGGLVALIDDADYALVEGWQIYPQVGKWTTYAQAYRWFGASNRIRKGLHRLILGATAAPRIDHHNGNGLDNRRVNLRECTNAQNGANARLSRRNTSGYKGVTWDKESRKWMAQLRSNGKRYNLGRFADPWDAAQAYNTAALDTWGEFALTNERIT